MNGNTQQEMNPLSQEQMNEFKGGAGLCGNAEIFFPNNPGLNYAVNYLAHLWQKYN